MKPETFIWTDEREAAERRKLFLFRPHIWAEIHFSECWPFVNKNKIRNFVRKFRILHIWHRTLDFLSIKTCIYTWPTKQTVVNSDIFSFAFDRFELINCQRSGMLNRSSRKINLHLHVFGFSDNFLIGFSCSHWTLRMELMPQAKIFIRNYHHKEWVSLSFYLFSFCLLFLLFFNIEMTQRKRCAKDE